jgi:hypothetical protein
VYIYALDDNSYTEDVLDYFKSKHDWKVIYKNISINSILEQFLEIVIILETFDVEVVPHSECIDCLLIHFTWEEIYVGYGSPLIGFFSKGKLVAITVSIIDINTLNRTSQEAQDFKVYTLNQEHILDEDTRIQLEDLFLENS